MWGFAEVQRSEAAGVEPGTRVFGYPPPPTHPFYRAGSEDVQMLLRPLFFTSFLIDDQLADEGLAGRGPVVPRAA